MATMTASTVTAAAARGRERLRSEVARSARWGFAHALPRLALERSAKAGDLHGRLVVEGSGGATPVEIFEQVRAAGPLHRSRFAFITASLPVVKEVLGSPDVHAGVEFSASGVLAKVQRWAWDDAPMGPLTPPSLLVTEPPAHTRYRKLVTRVFSARAVQGLRTRTEQIAAELLDGLDTDHPIDLVEAYCALLPVTVIAEILGVPAVERERVLAFGSQAAPSLDVGLSWATYRRVDTSLAGFDAWLGEHLEAVRREPGDDLLSQLVAARDEDGEGLSDIELKATAGLVLAAGFETTVNLLSNAIALLCEHPEQLAALRAEPEGWAGAVDEVLRYDPPVLLTGRTVVRDTEIAGRPVPAGAIVTTLLAGANRDPDVFERPDAFDVRRPNAGDHVSFSSGRHYCLGAALARMEGEVGLRALFDRFPDLRLEPGAERRATRILRGWERLPATLAP